MEARLKRWDDLGVPTRTDNTIVRRPKSSWSLPSLFGDEDVKAAVLAAARAAAAQEKEKKAEEEVQAMAYAQALGERADRRARYVRLAGLAAVAAAVATRADTRSARAGVLTRGTPEVQALRKFRGVAPRVAALFPCALPPILVHVMSPAALRVKRDKYLRRLVREDRKRMEEYSPQVEGEGGKSNLHTRTNARSLLPHDLHTITHRIKLPRSFLVSCCLQSPL